MSDTRTRMTIKAAVVVCVWLVTAAVGEDDSCKHVTPSLRLGGDVNIVALFDGHSGANCTMPDARGLQEMATLAWMVNALNHVQFIPGVKLGLSLYDTCSTTDVAQNALLAAVREKQCEVDKYSLGLLTTPKIASSLQPLTQLLHTSITLTNSQLLSTTTITTALVQLLTLNLVTTVDHIFSTSSKTLETFVRISRNQGICVLQTHLWGKEPETVEGLSGVVILFGPAEDLTRFNSSEEDTAQFIWITSGTWEASALDKLPTNTIIITTNPVVLRPPNANTSQSDVWASVNRHVFLDVASTLLQTVDRLKSGLAANCVNSTSKFCKNLPNFNKLPPTNSKKLVQNLFKTLRIQTNDDDAIFYIVNIIRQHSNSTTYLEKIIAYRVQDPRSNSTFQMTSLAKDVLIIAMDNTTKRCDLYVTNSTENEYLCRKCVDLRTLNNEINFSEVYFFSTVSFRNEGWVAALISISTMGVLCCLVIGVFIVVRKCNGDVLEGNPSFSFLLLFAIVLAYASIIPFSVRIPQYGALCGFRIFATCISYALIFSIMLSRSLMLASCDKEGGFMSHVNGYLQTVLCFFMSGVQIALSVQFWIINSYFLPTEQCTFYEGPLFLVILSYDAFLLLILLCATPFVVHSKRNYREGMFFTAGTVLCTAVWIVWVLAYVLIPDYRDAIVATGLTSTATAVLITVFIPRTYLMISALTRDNIANALPAMAYSSTSILDLNYRSSNQALYATVNLPRETTQNGGQTNANYYADSPHESAADRAVAKCQSSYAYRGDATAENTYERYDTPPSPLKVTRF